MRERGRERESESEDHLCKTTVLHVRVCVREGESERGREGERESASEGERERGREGVHLRKTMVLHDVSK